MITRFTNYERIKEEELRKNKMLQRMANAQMKRRGCNWICVTNGIGENWKRGWHYM